MMTDEKKVPERPTKNFPGPNGEPNPVYDYFVTIDPGTGEKVAVLLTEYLTPEKVVIERVFLVSGIRPEEEMLLEEFEKEKRVASGKEYKDTVHISGWGIFPCKENFRTITESGDTKVYVIDDSDPEKIKVLYYFYQNCPSEIRTITKIQLEQLKKDNEEIRKCVVQRAWGQIKLGQKELRPDEKRDV